MKKFIKFIAVILCLPLTLGFFGCNDDGDSADFYYFNTQINVVVYKGSLTDKVKNKINEVLDGLEKGYSVNNPNSFTEQFNNLQVGKTLNVSSQTIEILSKATESYDFSDGKFNPRVYPLVRLWGFSPQFPVEGFSPPSNASINAVLQNGLDFANSFTISETVLTKTSDAEIDLGGILKGFASDKIANVLKENGYKDGFINVGGSSLSLLDVSMLNVMHPRKDGHIISITKGLERTTISTSGDYQRYYLYNGIRYSHLINPQDGYPVNTGIQSATVVLPENQCALADALSTALCLCSYQKDNDTLTPLINKILTEFPSAQLYLVYEADGVKTILTNKKKGVDFTLLDSDYSVTTIG